MSLFSTLSYSDHDLIATLRFLGDYAKHVHERGLHREIYRYFVPRFDLDQHADTYELYGELPGFKREDIVIEAHDDRTLQVSGSIGHLSSHESPVSATKQVPISKDKDGRNPTQESAPLPPPPAADPLEKTTTRQESYLNARFGDVLNPHPDSFRSQNGHSEDAAPSQQQQQQQQVRCLISERHPSSFHRVFHFPTPIRREAIAATMLDGILHLTAPRAPAPPPVKVKVRGREDEDEDSAPYGNLIV